MNIDYNFISKNPLFNNIQTDEIKTIMNCLNANVYKYMKDSYVYMVGEPVSSVGILLSGKLSIIKENEDGIRNIIESIEPGESFGEVFACSENTDAPISVVANKDSSVLLLNYKRIITVCSSACTHHSLLIENMLKKVAKRALELQIKLDIVSKRRMRAKLMAFLEYQKRIAGESKFTIPFNREELADYLFVERSALSAELCRMRDEGLIKFNKNSFEIL